MIVVADMGSTKTDWSFVDTDKNIVKLSTKGFNPYFYSTEEIIVLLKSEFSKQTFNWNEITNVYFYGSGCSSKDKQRIVKNALLPFFPKAELFISHDLLASARAVCGKNKGIACILGTGANTCLFDGENIIANNPSLGFLLGDEGSGGDLGRELIKYYQYGELPKEIEEKFELQYNMNRQKLLDEVYSTKHPNAYCAAYSTFVNENKSNPVIKQMIEERMEEFFKRHVSKYEGHQNIPINFVGSIAHYFEENLKTVAQKFGCSVGVIVKNPVNLLIAYHTN
jgi:N-acetylglucosamine kinase-like BadF-type ATPase